MIVRPNFNVLKATSDVGRQPLKRNDGNAKDVFEAVKQYTMVDSVKYSARVRWTSRHQRSEKHYQGRAVRQIQSSDSGDMLTDKG